jgi:hypothetical protein
LDLGESLDRKSQQESDEEEKAHHGGTPMPKITEAGEKFADMKSESSVFLHLCMLCFCTFV